MEDKSKLRLVGLAFLGYLVVVSILIAREVITGFYFIPAVVIEVLIIAYWGLLLIKIRRKIRQKLRSKSKPAVVKGTDKEFEYYCSNCLYQANVNFKTCPKCETGKAVKIKS